jgi:hypothetical protein
MSRQSPPIIDSDHEDTGFRAQLNLRRLPDILESFRIKWNPEKETTGKRDEISARTSARSARTGKHRSIKAAHRWRPEVRNSQKLLYSPPNANSQIR